MAAGTTSFQKGARNPKTDFRRSRFIDNTPRATAGQRAKRTATSVVYSDLISSFGRAFSDILRVGAFRSGFGLEPVAQSPPVQPE